MKLIKSELVVCGTFSDGSTSDLRATDREQAHKITAYFRSHGAHVEWHLLDTYEVDMTPISLMEEQGDAPPSRDFPPTT